MIPRSPWRHTSLRTPIAGVLLLLCLAPSPAFPQHPPTQYDVQAAYLFRFSKFLRLPPRTSPPPAGFDICVLGEDHFGPTLRQITQKETVDGLPVRVLHLDRSQDAHTCAILFVAASEAPRLDDDLAALHGSDVLTVSDMPHFLDRGGMIQFVIEQDRVRFPSTSMPWLPPTSISAQSSFAWP